MSRMKYNMDINTANDILQNVFAAKQQAPNTTPFDKIVLKSKARTSLVTSCMWVGIIMLCLTILSPLAFRSTDFKVTDFTEAQNLQIVEHQLFTEEFVMIVSGSKLDYQSVYASKNDGTVIFPSRIRFINGNAEITIPYDGEALNLFIPDTDGNVMQAILSER